VARVATTNLGSAGEMALWQCAIRMTRVGLRASARTEGAGVECRRRRGVERRIGRGGGRRVQDAIGRLWLSGEWQLVTLGVS
jgi:hypothetical protein